MHVYLPALPGLVVTPIFPTQKINDPVSGQELIALQLTFDAYPLTGRKELTEFTNRLLAADDSCLYQMTCFIPNHI
jgi:hypothetical protein